MSGFLFPLPDFMYPNSVLIRAVGTTTDGSADDTPTPSPGTPCMASVQMASAGQIAMQMRQGSDSPFTVYFAAEPLDTSSGADHAHLRVRDLIVWQVNPADASTWRTLVIDGPTRNEGGGSVAWSFDCTERV